jgi:hypothetical protein
LEEVTTARGAEAAVVDVAVTVAATVTATDAAIRARRLRAVRLASSSPSSVVVSAVDVVLLPLLKRLHVF